MNTYSLKFPPTCRISQVAEKLPTIPLAKQSNGSRPCGPIPSQKLSHSSYMSHNDRDIVFAA